MSCERIYLRMITPFFFSNEPHVGWCNDNATSNPSYSHAIHIALARPGTHEIPPSVTDHNKLVRPSRCEKGSQESGFAWGPYRQLETPKSETRQ